MVLRLEINFSVLQNLHWWFSEIKHFCQNEKAFVRAEQPLQAVVSSHLEIILSFFFTFTHTDMSLFDRELLTEY